MRRTILALFLTAAALTAAAKPYRILVVVDKWSDPASVLVDAAKDRFQPVAALLKAWTVPFDILRLDQQAPGASYLFERDGKPRYGAIIWLAAAAKNAPIVKEAVEAGSSLLVAGVPTLDPNLAGILGLEPKDSFTADDPAHLDQPHFITRELAADKNLLALTGTGDVNLWAAPRGAVVLVSQSGHPLVTIRQFSDRTSAIWLAAPETTRLRDVPAWRSLFFRSLVWSLGYLVTPGIDYAHRFILEFDDWGTADKGFLSYWRYPTLSEQTIAEHLVAPLTRNKATMVANVITGYVDRESKRILSPWTRKFTDRFGVLQDYGSTQRGLEKAAAAGVLEIQSHGWTHMQPDLDSPPGPWWTADLAGEATAIPWYEEFLDRRHGIEVPAQAQLFHIERSIEYLRRDFDARPLSLRPGGAAWSTSWANHTGRLAAQAGFGLFHAGHTTNFYLDRDLVIDMAGIAPEAAHEHDARLAADKWPAHPDGPVVLTVHDRDVALQPDFVDRLFADLPAGYTTMGMNQYVAILHAKIGYSEAGRVTFDFDEHYCRFFKDHPSAWRLWMADPSRESVAIDLAPGLGTRTWKLAD